MSIRAFRRVFSRGIYIVRNKFPQHRKNCVAASFPKFMISRVFLFSIWRLLRLSWYEKTLSFQRFISSDCLLFSTKEKFFQALYSFFIFSVRSICVFTLPLSKARRRSAFCRDAYGKHKKPTEKSLSGERDSGKQGYILFSWLSSLLRLSSSAHRFPMGRA